MNEKHRAGRPGLPVEEKMVSKTHRFTPAQISKLDILGGAKWMRRKIDQAKLK